MKRITMISFFGCFVAIVIVFSAPFALAGNKVLVLDGIEDYMEAPHIDFTSAFTVEAWVFSPNYTGETILSQLDTMDGINKHLHIIIRDGKPYLGFWGNDLPGTSKLKGGIWYHLAYQYTGTEQRIYVNGILDSSRNTSAYEGKIGETFIGRLVPHGVFWDGLIDEVRIWNVARTQEEIQTNMDKPLENPKSDGIGCFESANSMISGSLVNANTLLNNGANSLSNNTPNIINATFNYWGTTDEAEIAAMIQNTGSGSVKFKPFVTEYNKIVADVSGNGTISAYDAALILQFVVGLIDTFPVSIPKSPEQTTPRNYTVSLPSLAAHAGKYIQAPVAINDANGLTAGGIILKYDPTVLKAVDVLPTITLNGSYWKANTKLDGEIRFAFACTSASEESSQTTQSLFMVEFEVLPNTTGKVSPLILDKVQFSESQNISKINGSVVVLPERSILLQNYPNPFNPETWIPYQLAADSPVMISIYNSKGQLIRVLNLGNQNAGIYMTKNKAAYWDGKDRLGEKVVSGVYFYTLRVGKFVSTRKMVIVK